MTDRVNLNPFTGLAFTASEIKELDTNNDGIITSDEFDSNVNFISRYEQQDAEGDVQIDDGKKEDSAAKMMLDGSWSITRGAVDPAVSTLKSAGNLAEGVGGAVVETVKGGFEGAKSFWGGAAGMVSSTVGGYWGGISGLVSGFWGGVGNIFRGNIFKGFGSIFGGVAKFLYKPILGIGKGILKFGKGCFGLVSNIGKGIFKAAKKTVKSIGKGISTLANGVASGVKAVGKGIANVGKAIGKGIKKIFKGW